MCSWILAVTTAWLAGELVPSPTAYEGTCWPVDQSRFCPRTFMPAHTASPTRASPLAKSKVPLLGSNELHFSSLPGVMLSKCLVNNCACGPERSDISTAAPIGNKSEYVL